MNPERRNRLAAAIVLVAIIAVAAAIVLTPRHVEVTWEGEGEVVPDGGDIRFYETLTLSVQPADGWRVSSVTIDGSAADADSGTFTVSVSVLDFSTHSVHVVFEEIGDIPPETHTITVTHSSGGTVEPSGEVLVEDGGSVSFELVPDTGYRLSYLELDGSRVAHVSDVYTMTDVREDHDLHVVFSRASTPGGGGDDRPYLTGIEVTRGPYRTVYAAGDSFDPTGMVVTARYSDGSSRVLSDDEYALSPTGPLSPDDDGVTVSYRGMTATVDIVVVVPGDFSVIVTEHWGTRVVDGALESFHETPDERLGDFGFYTSGIVPGVVQTARMEVTNGTSVGLDCCVYISGLDIDGGPELASQLTLAVKMGDRVVSTTVAQMAEGVLLNIGSIPEGGTVTLEVTLEFPHSDDNNSAMGQSVSFTLGVFADDPPAHHE